MDAVIPIREISRLTGVNSVTLRAWERRYGLIKPLRTSKGHRLYRHQDVELVRTIQSWLARGLAIGKVSELLESGNIPDDFHLENIWQTYYEDLLAIMAELNLGKLDGFLNQLFSVYPAALVADQLIAPVLDDFNQSRFANGVKKAIFMNRVSEYLLMLVQHQRQQANGKRIAIIHLNNPASSLLSILLHYDLVMSQIKSELVGLISVAEVVFAVEKLMLDGLIVYNDSCSSLAVFQKELVLLAQKITLPIAVGGAIVTALNVDFPANIFIASDGSHQSLIAKVSAIFPRTLAEDNIHED